MLSGRLPTAPTRSAGLAPNARTPVLLLLFVFMGAMLSALRGADPRTIVFFGDSLTAGYGLANPTAQSYPGLIQEKIAAAGLHWRVVNAGVSGDTTAGGLRRVDWVLRQPVDIFVLALGANDGLRGISPAVSRSNLQEILERVRAKNPKAQLIVAGMQMPDIMGADFARDFREMFPAVAKKYDAVLIPFLLAEVGGRLELNLDDRIHPNVAGHERIAETVWDVLRPLL